MTSLSINFRALTDLNDIVQLRDDMGDEKRKQICGEKDEFGNVIENKKMNLAT